jgi:AraC-like DNA-binding protein
MLRPPTAGRFQKALKHLTGQGEKFDAPVLKKAYFETRVVTRQQYDSVLQLLSIFAQQLAALSNQLMVRQVAQESPTVAHARQFIAEHHSEEISLAQVAQSVHMSRFYFCKIFKEGTGLTFVEYLARVRVETVKRLLLDPHKRMSEAAYEAGFQSLSQFNRVFRFIAGEPPSAYSEKMRQVGGAPHRLNFAA